jgi:hypothetical protein
MFCFRVDVRTRAQLVGTGRHSQQQKAGLYNSLHKEEVSSLSDAQEGPQELET